MAKLFDEKAKTDTCALCGGCGVVVRDLKFKRCICSAGEAPGVSEWEEKPVHPEDLCVA